MNTLTFVILHYKSIEDTTKCVNSIITNLNNNYFKIVIVDNGSNNGTGEQLKELYNDNINIFIILSNENLGFSRGNNLGCEYAIRNYNSDYLCVINNDTIVRQKDFIERIDAEYKISKFDVLGPDIIAYSESHQNPFNEEIVSYNSIRKHLIKMKILILYYSLNLNYINLLDIYQDIRKKLLNGVKSKSNSKNLSYLIRQSNVALHGSALIFSKKYYSKYADVFYPEIFMYSEEDFLNYRRKRDCLTFIYNPDIKIIHKEDYNIKALFDSDKQKRLFLYKNSFKSVLKLYKTMKKQRFKFQSYKITGNNYEYI